MQSSPFVWSVWDGSETRYQGVPQLTALLICIDLSERTKMLKTCPKCKVVKESLEFYKNRSRRDGFTWGCKDCCQENQRKYRQTKAGKEVHQRGSQKYSKTEGGRGVHQKARQKHHLLHPEQKEAHSIVREAIRLGKITRPFLCELCFKKCKPEGHHEDYSKPLDVDWLCAECHSKIRSKV